MTHITVEQEADHFKTENETLLRALRESERDAETLRHQLASRPSQDHGLVPEASRPVDAPEAVSDTMDLTVSAQYNVLFSLNVRAAQISPVSGPF